MFALTFLSFGVTHALAGDKAVPIETVPPGAQVEVNGSVTCITPCSITVPGSYFGRKHTVFSTFPKEPIRVRLTKEGYVPKTVDLSTGPLQLRHLNGVYLGNYYMMSADHFKFQLDAVQDLVPATNTPDAPLIPTSVTSRPGSASVEDLVRQTLPAVVRVSTSDGGWGSGFFVTPDGVVVTNAHVMRDESGASLSSATVIMASGRSLESSHIYVDEERGLALIKVSVKDNPFDNPLMERTLMLLSRTHHFSSPLKQSD